MMNEPRYKPGDVLCDEKYEILCSSWWKDGQVVYDVYEHINGKRYLKIMNGDDLNEIVDRYHSSLTNHYVKIKAGDRLGIVVLSDGDCYRVMYYAKNLDDFLINVYQRIDLFDLGENTEAFKETLERLKEDA